MSAAEQLERILHILPLASRDDGVALDDLARSLGVEVKTIIRDLEQVTARAYYHPAATVDPFTILIEDDRVYVHSSTEFTRPARLSDREALALGLGLRTLAAEHEEPRRSEILALALRLERDLVVPEIAVQPRLREPPAAFTLEAPPPEYGSIELGDDDFRGIISDAIEARQVCRIEYLKPSEVASAERRIAPQQLVYANGRWYIAAYDLERRAARLFRLDRILAVAPLDERVEAEQVQAVTQELPTKQYSLWPEEDLDTEVVVRYSPRIARWISEQGRAQPDQDGGVRVQHQVSDARWLVRHVLQYGGEAVVESPPYRRLVSEAARRLSA